MLMPFTKKTMKKLYTRLISAVLAAVVCVSTFMPAWAADAEYGQTTETVTNESEAREEGGMNAQEEEQREQKDMPDTRDDSGIAVAGEMDEPPKEELPEQEEETKEFAVDDIKSICLGEKPVVVAHDLEGNVLVEGTDYEVEYPETDVVGTATVTVTGIGDYAGTIEKEFQVCYDLGKASKIADIASVTYSGKEHKPNPEVTYDGKKLVPDVDYTISYENNVNAGTAKVVITGIGQYRGAVTKNFTINKAKNVITASDIKVNFSAKEQVVKIKVSTKDKSAELSFDNACYHDGRAVIKIDKDGNATIPERFLKTEKVKIKAKATKNYKSASKTIKITGVVDKFPYTSKSHVYKKVSTVGNAVLKKLRARDTKFRVNFDITEHGGAADLMSMYVSDYVQYHQSKNYPFTLMEWTSPASAMGAKEITATYKGHGYGTLLYEKYYQMSKKKEDAFIAKLNKTLKSIGALSGSDYSRTKAIYKWITKNIHYAYCFPFVPDHSYNTAYMTFTHKRGICQGYGRLMKAMCNLAGVDCIYVEGDGHAWCLVKNGKKWYACDPTFDRKKAPAYWQYFMQPYGGAFKSVRGHREIQSEYLEYNNINFAK